METRTFTADELKTYSDAIAATVREACAKEAAGYHDHADCGHGEGYMNGRDDAAAAIRALRETTT